MADASRTTRCRNELADKRLNDALAFLGRLRKDISTARYPCAGRDPMTLLRLPMITSTRERHFNRCLNFDNTKHSEALDPCLRRDDEPVGCRVDRRFGRIAVREKALI